MTTTPPPPTLTHFATAEVAVGEAIDLGETIDGRRRVIPIRGGVVTGNGWSGRVLDAGADYQQYPTDETAYLTAMYVMEADDGTRLFVDNRALRTGSKEDLAKLVSGERVDPARIYFRFTPRITSAVDGPFAWVNTTLFIGTGVRLPNAVQLAFFAVD
ncbi:hypothetical protein GCM10011490_14770 [Pseudoclavibacter endophyticus]|uniref:UPF0311 protein F8O04_02290 n=1 Tax=Pseudoclavibacter endophyticus TaxID=1778590 RepID=A0A6H9WDV7_9MICO|nr:DUF3237 family protein [Pseudoclavibacter endophyticus]KAB1649132.1 DUF3237 family protein [Pseudoclavibacter endophyticus]GGA65149.1 hypothetical protein GCM10011490_14770 [Pseudoclavibacter endophyticus]